MDRHVNSSSRRPGRPPSQKARRAIVLAARKLIEERGPTGVTMEGAAALAGVGKPTVYRHFADRHELAMAALMQMATPEGGMTQPGAPLQELKRQLLAMAALFESPTGRFVTSVLASGHGETEMSKAFRSHFIEQRREQSRKLLLESKQAGAIRRDANVELALDQLYGPILYRLLIGHSPVNRELVGKLLGQLLEGIGCR
jgi:AcrR family transcriptional regulator